MSHWITAYFSSSRWHTWGEMRAKIFLKKNRKNVFTESTLHVLIIPVEMKNGKRKYRHIETFISNIIVSKRKKLCRAGFTGKSQRLERQKNIKVSYGWFVSSKIKQPHPYLLHWCSELFSRHVTDLNWSSQRKKIVNRRDRGLNEFCDAMWCDFLQLYFNTFLFWESLFLLATLEYLPLRNT